MVAEVTERVREIAHHRDLNESEIIQQAVEKGVLDLWRDVVLDRYLAGDITRQVAVEELGPEVIRDGDRAQAAVEVDVEWGLQDEAA